MAFTPASPEGRKRWLSDREYVIDAPEPTEPMVTLRMPLSNWRGIVNGIGKWAGGSASEHEILQDIELIDGHGSAIWWLNNFYGDPDD
ncbi:MAG TPA: hypothetical protein VLI04_14820 [Nocardioidaceae bacterium]|nr:hypothetical protein [Nocardioidaceae bacterium]